MMWHLLIAAVALAQDAEEQEEEQAEEDVMPPPPMQVQQKLEDLEDLFEIIEREEQAKAAPDEEADPELACCEVEEPPEELLFDEAEEAIPEPTDYENTAPRDTLVETPEEQPVEE